MNRPFSLFVGSLGLVAASTLGAAEPPTLIPFQGHLAKPTEDAGYVAVASGQYDVLFTLYAAPVGGESKVWGPERHTGVVVVNGLVNAMLGSVTGFEDALAADANFFARPLYVGITIDADGNPSTADLELVPRQVLLPSVYSHNANRLDGGDWRTFFVGTDNEATFTEGTTKARDADKLDGFDWDDVFDNGDPTTGKIAGSKIADQTIGTVNIAAESITSEQIAPNTLSGDDLNPEFVEQVTNPPGAIIAFGGDNIPDGWLLCDGRVFDQAVYPDLYSAIGTAWGAGTAESETDFHLPDLRAMFLRGVQGEKPGPSFVDPDRDARVEGGAGGNIGNAVGTIQGEQFKSHTHTRPHTTTPYSNSGEYNGGEGRRRGSGTSAYSTGATGGNETRPINAYVHYIIKY